MLRRNALFMFGFLAGCGSSRKDIAAAIPAELPGGWRRGDILPLAEVPQVVTQLGPEESVQTTYTGPASVAVRVFRMKAETSAFELIQKWRQSEGLAAYSGPYFFVASGERAGEVLRELQKAVR